MKINKTLFENYWFIFFIYLFLSLIYFAYFLFSSKMIYGTDWLMGVYANRFWMTEFIKENHRIALWNPYERAGMPTVAGFFGDIFTFTNFLRLFLPIYKVWTIGFFLAITFAGFGTFLFLRSMNIKTLNAFIGGLFYTGAGTLLTTPYAGHFGRLLSASMLPLILYFLHRGLKKTSLIDFLIAGGIAGISFLGGHFQMTYYAYLCAFFFFLYYLILKRKKLSIPIITKLIIFAVAGVIVSFLMYSFYIFPVLENLKYAARGVERGYEYATSWSHPPLETINLLFPHFSGYLETYWGEEVFKLHSEYMGILPVIFAIGGILFFSKNRYVLFFVIWLVFSFIYAIGAHTPFFKIFYYLLPGIKKFRAPSLIFYNISFSLTILSVFFLNSIGNKKESQKLKYFLIGSVIFLFFVAFIITVLKDTFINYGISTIKGYKGDSSIQEKISALNKNYPLFIRDAWIGFFISVPVIALLYFYKGKNILPLLLLILPLHLFDTWRIGKEFLKSVPEPKEYYKKDEVIQFLEQDREIYRVFPLRYEHSMDGLLTINNIESIGGYTANPLQRYQNFIGAGTSVMFTPENLIQYPNFINLLNAKYIIDVPLPENIEGYSPFVQNQILLWKNFYKGYEKVGSFEKAVIYKNPRAFPRFFLLKNYEIFDSKEEVLEKLKFSSFETLRTTAFLEREFVGNLPLLEQKEEIDSFYVNVLSYSADRIELKIFSSSGGILVISQNWHPGWKAKINNENAKTFPVDYTLTGVVLKKGISNVILFFTSKAHKWGFYLSVFGYIIFIFSLIFSGGRFYLKK